MFAKVVNFTDPQAAWLREEAKRLDIRVSELIRRALDDFIRRQKAEQRAIKREEG